jgi:hypothetical protein
MGWVNGPVEGVSRFNGAEGGVGEGWWNGSGRLVWVVVRSSQTILASFVICIGSPLKMEIVWLYYTWSRSMQILFVLPVYPSKVFAIASQPQPTIRPNAEVNIVLASNFNVGWDREKRPYALQNMG